MAVSKQSKLVAINKLKSFLVNEDELINCASSLNSCLARTFKTCLKECLGSSPNKNRKLEIEVVLDYLHDELNTGHWSTVPLSVRNIFTAASYIKTLILLSTYMEVNQTLLEQCLKCLDMGLLLGAPLQENPELLTESASFISKEINKLHSTRDCGKKLVDSEVTRTKRKLDEEYLDQFKKLKGVEIINLSCPSLETFNNDFLVPQKPVKIRDGIKHWPAVTKWLDVNYIINIAGERTVPVEIGSHYADEKWCQKLMTIRDFVKSYYLQSNNLGYLAQHNLFDQIPELKNDICIPEYCFLSSNNCSCDPDINAWFGPKGTVSPLHHDPKDNILAQVFGSKQVILFSPDDTPYLYPHKDKLLSNTAQVDPINPKMEEHEHFKYATSYKCILEAGEMLYIPKKWWHHITALDKSFSVSFWWQ